MLRMAAEEGQVDFEAVNEVLQVEGEVNKIEFAQKAKCIVCY